MKRWWCKHVWTNWDREGSHAYQYRYCRHCNRCQRSIL